MSTLLADQLARLQAAASTPGSLPLIENRLIGVEKESLRVASNGVISTTDHPAALGSALTNAHITTDYSEALLEIVTPPLHGASQVLQFLRDAHHYIYPRLPDGETIWATSMPCVLEDCEAIRIGEYGSSHAATMKHAYRRGLGLRYGRTMQVIAGVHFNFSWPAELWSMWPQLSGRPAPERAPDRLCSMLSDEQAYITHNYFHVTRNLLRYGWLVPYLFGASPAICRSFLGGADPLPGMEIYNNTTCYEPYGTSLRMGDIGYQYKKDSDIPIRVGYAGLEDYVGDLVNEITRPHPRYQALGLHDEDGAWQQLSVNRLQIENEYYSSVRPKQLPEGTELPLLAMARRGIRYLELRSIDVNVFDPVGISERQIHFFEVFMLYCLLKDSPKFATGDIDRISENMARTAHRGREPGLKLAQVDNGGNAISLADWGRQLLDEMQGVAEILDAVGRTDCYTHSLKVQQEKMADSEATPSARLIREMLANHGSYFEFAFELSRQNEKTLRDAENARIDFFDRLGDASRLKQRQMEAGDQGTFEDFLADQFAQLDEPELSRFRYQQKVAAN